MTCSDEMRNVLQKSPGVVFAYLFGSRARNAAGQRSDWDIAVFFRKEAFKRNPWTRFYLEGEISRVLGDVVQVVALNSVESPLFLSQVVREGVLLLDRSPEERLLFEAKVMRSYYDWLYYQNRRTGMASESPGLIRKMRSQIGCKTP